MTLEEAISQLKSLRDNSADYAKAADDEPMWNDDVEALTIAIAALRERGWVSVKDRLPENEEKVLVFGISKYKDPQYKDPSREIFCAEYIRKMTVKTDDFGWSAYCDYDAGNDEYYVPEGWYEMILSWNEYTSIAVLDFDITHWMPLTQPPMEDEKP